MNRYLLAPIAGVIFLAGTLLAQLCTGPFGISPCDVFNALIDPSSPDRFFVFTLGLPRYVVGMLAGIALGSSGAMFQALAHRWPFWLPSACCCVAVSA